nr:hypothetical protein [Tanacetum cinerariifolium]
MKSFNPNNDKRKVTQTKIQDLLEKRIEKAEQHLNKEKQIMHINKEKEKMVIERATFDESYDHNPFQVTSDDTSDDTLKSSSEDTCSSDCTWEQKKLLKNQGLDLPKQKKPFEDIHQLIEECSVEVPEQQKQKMENTIALDSKLLSINSINSQHLEKNEQEVKNVEEQPVGRRNHAEKSLQNFRVIHKSSISFKNTSQISLIHSVAPIQSTKEPEHSLSMGYEHLSITPETESDEVTESNAENLLPISSKCEEPSYNQNYDDNYYPHESPSFPCCDYYGESHETSQCQPMDHNIDFFGSDQNPQYPEKQCEQMQDDLLNQMRNFMQNFQNGPPGEDKEHEATTDTKLLSTEDIQPLPVQEPPQNSDMHQLIEECCVEAKFLCIHDDVDDLIKSALNSKLLLINPKSQHPDKKEQEVKNVEEQQAERRNQPEHSLSMGYEHLILTPETESDTENLLPIPSKCEVTSEDDIECDMPSKDDCSPVFTTISNPLFQDNDDLDSSDDESLFDEDDGNSQHEEIDIVTETEDVLPSKGDIRFLEELLIDDFILSDELSDANFKENPLIPRPLPEPPDVESFFDLKPDVIADNSDDSSNDPLLEEVDLFLSDDSIPPGIENVADDPEGDIRFLEELLIDDSILSHESSDDNFEENPLISRPPPEPPDDNFDLEPEVISAVMEDIDEPDEHFNPGGEIFVSTKIEDDDYFPFMFVIRFFLPYLILPKISPLLLSAKSEDTIFDPGISD